LLIETDRRIKVTLKHDSTIINILIKHAFLAAMQGARYRGGFTGIEPLSNALLLRCYHYSIRSVSPQLFSGIKDSPIYYREQSVIKRMNIAENQDSNPIRTEATATPFDFISKGAALASVDDITLLPLQ